MSDNKSENSFFNPRFGLAFLISFIVIYGFDFVFGKFYKNSNTKIIQSSDKSQENHNDEKKEKSSIDEKSSKKIKKFKVENDKMHFFISNYGIIDEVVFRNYNKDPEIYKFSDIFANKEGLDNFTIDLLNEDFVFSKSEQKSPDSLELVYKDSSMKDAVKISVSIFNDYLIKVKKEYINSYNSKNFLKFSMFDNFDKKIKAGLHGYNSENKIINFDRKKIYSNSIDGSLTFKKNQWVGFYDKYSLITILNKLDNDIKSSIYINGKKADLSFSLSGEPSKLDEFFIYAGPRKFSIIDKIQKDFDIKMLDRSIDFGLFYFLTKPLLIMLNVIYKIVGNYGLAIILLTILVKIVILPFSNKSYSSMSKMSSLAPKISDIKNRTKDPIEQQKMIIELYKKNNVSPISGCLPILIQIPLFFALYKLFDTSIDIRNEKFLWIPDLSEQDPFSVFNLFGLIKISLPSFLNIGILPILMSLTMYIQQLISSKKVENMTEQEKTNRNIMLYFMPIFMCFAFSNVASGLVLYWTVSNIFGIVNQYIVNKNANNSKN